MQSISYTIVSIYSIPLTERYYSEFLFPESNTHVFVCVFSIDYLGISIQRDNRGSGTSAPLASFKLDLIYVGSTSYCACATV